MRFAHLRPGLRVAHTPSSRHPRAGGVRPARPREFGGDPVKHPWGTKPPLLFFLPLRLPTRNRTFYFALRLPTRNRAFEPKVHCILLACLDPRRFSAHTMRGPGMTFIAPLHRPIKIPDLRCALRIFVRDRGWRTHPPHVIPAPGRATSTASGIRRGPSQASTIAHTQPRIRAKGSFPIADLPGSPA